MDETPDDVSLAGQHGGIHVLRALVEVHADVVSIGNDVEEVRVRRPSAVAAGGGIREVNARAVEVAGRDARDLEAPATGDVHGGAAEILAPADVVLGFAVDREIAEAPVVHALLYEDALGAVGANDSRAARAHERHARGDRHVAAAIEARVHAYDPGSPGECRAKGRGVVRVAVEPVGRAPVRVHVLLDVALHGNLHLGLNSFFREVRGCESHQYDHDGGGSQGRLLSLREGRSAPS